MFLSESSQNHNQSSFPFEICNLLLGKGGSGQVFLGRVSNTDRYVAIKKRYAKADTNAAKMPFLLLKDTAVPNNIHQFASQAPQSPLTFSLSGQESITMEPRSTRILEPGDGCVLSQRREFDHGEESVTEVAAFSQQGSNQLLDLDGELTAAAPLEPRVPMDEVSILHFLGPHPQLVKFLGNYTTSKYASYYTMELMDSDVARELKETNRSFQTESVCIGTIYSILKALEYLHSRGVAHRDVKPGNILLKKLTQVEDWPCLRVPAEIGGLNQSLSTHFVPPSSNNATEPCVRAALGDFSAAHSVMSLEDTTFADTRGTLHYKAPEQLMGRRGTVADNFTAVDLWGLGCTMYEMVTGERPFPGSSELQVLMNILDLLGSDIQSFPSSTRPPGLFQNLTVSSPFLDLLQRLLHLDPSARPSAGEALSHPVFESLRQADACFQKSQNENGEKATQPIFGIPLELKYASFTPVPQLRFSRISRTPFKTVPLAPELRNGADAPFLAYAASQSAADGEAAALMALTHYAQREVPASRHEANPNATHAIVEEHQHANEENRAAEDAVHAGCGQHRSPDTTAVSFMSEGSYLHWSEIRPVARPSAPLESQPQRPTLSAADILDQSASGPAESLVGANVGSTPSSSTNYRQRQRLHFSETSRAPSTSVYRNTVARALNISDSSIKVARTERSTSHCDFDLSPVAATQLFSADADLSARIVPHAGFAAIPRPPVPVIQLKSGSTFTASNLRANSSFERDGNAVGGGLVRSSSATTALLTRNATGNTAGCNSFSTPRESALLRTTAYAGRALCFSEETDRLARHSNGSCPSQQSCLNSLLTSPAPLSRVHEVASPQPSPIRSVGAAARSPSGLPLVERSGLSSDDSGVGLAWMGLDLDAGAAGSASGSGSACAATAAPPLHDTKRTAPVLSAARVELQPNSYQGSAGTVRCSFSESPHTRRCLPRPTAKDSTTQHSTSPLPSAIADPHTGSERDDRGAQGRHNSTCTENASTVRLLPLPIPLSLASGNQTPRSPSSPLPTPKTSALRRDTPQTQRVLSAGGSVSSAEHATEDVGEVQDFQSQDMNVPQSFITQKQRRFVKQESDSRGGDDGSVPRGHITVPAYHVVTAARSQRHCTPSSMEPGCEPSVLQPREAQQTSSIRVAEVADLLHSTPSVPGAPGGARVVVRPAAAGGQRHHGETRCSVTPRSTERTVHKRSREEATMEERAATAGESPLH